MTTPSLHKTTALYDLQSSANIENATVSHPKFREFCRLLKRLSNEVRELDDDCWARPLRTLRFYRFDMCAAPLGFGNESIVAAMSLPQLQEQLEQCVSYYPRFGEVVSGLLSSLGNLIVTNENPLLDALSDRVDGSQPAGLLLKESRHILPTSMVLKETGLDSELEVISEYQLRRSTDVRDVIFCVGSSRWFAEYIFRSPRALKTQIVRFSWIPDSDCRKTPVLSGWKRVREELERTKRLSPAAATIASSNEPEVTSSEDWLNDEELVPQFDLTRIADRFASTSREGESGLDEVTGRLFILEGDRGVFLEVDDSSTTLVIDLGEDTISQVHRFPIKSLQEGMFVLLRGESDESGEYIVPIANKVLRDRANSLREFQRKWKGALRNLVLAEGIETVLARLEANGAIRASETNVRNWLSERNIKTEASEDFYAIMRTIGLGDKENQCWIWAREIARAHTQAGRLVRNQLLKQVRKTNLNDLEKLGEMKFELREVGGKPLYALRIVKVTGTTRELHYHNLNKVFKLEEN